VREIQRGKLSELDRAKERERMRVRGRARGRERGRDIECLFPRVRFVWNEM
jgi:hypothetical protein